MNSAAKSGMRRVRRSGAQEPLLLDHQERRYRDPRADHTVYGHTPASWVARNSLRAWRLRSRESPIRFHLGVRGRKRVEVRRAAAGRGPETGMNGLIALNFHGIGTPAREIEPGEAPYWVATERFDAILDRIAAHPERARIRITFDDGNLSDLTVALPALGRAASRGFLRAERADRRAGIARCGGHRRAAGGGHGGRQPRGRPPPLGRLALRTALAAELEGSKARLEEVCGRPRALRRHPFRALERRRPARPARGGLHRRPGRATAASRGGGFPRRAHLGARGHGHPDEIDAILAGRMDPARVRAGRSGVARKRWLA